MMCMCVVGGLQLDHTLQAYADSLCADGASADCLIPPLNVPLVKLDIEGCEIDGLMTLLPALTIGSQPTPKGTYPGVERLPHMVVEVCPLVWERCHNNITEAIAVFQTLQQLGYQILSFEVAEPTEAALPHLRTRQSTPLHHPLFADLILLHMDTPEQVIDLLLPDTTEIIACIQMWMKPPWFTL